MEYLIGVALALGVSVGGTIVGLDRDRAFYTAIALVVGSYYLLFAAMAGSTLALGWETVGFVGVSALAIVGFLHVVHEEGEGGALQVSEAFQRFTATLLEDRCAGTPELHRMTLVGSYEG